MGKWGRVLTGKEEEEERGSGDGPVTKDPE